MSIRICPNCGQHNPTGTWYCAKCGETLSVNTITELDHALVRLTVDEDAGARPTMSSALQPAEAPYAYSPPSDWLTMHYPVEIDGFEGHNLIVEVAGWFIKSSLIIDGESVAQGSKKGQFRLRRNDGSEVFAELRSGIIDPVPQISIEGKTIRVGKPLGWYQWLWAIGLPFVLLVAFFALGLPVATGCIPLVVLVFPAMNFNLRIFHTGMDSPTKYTRTAIMSVLAAIVNSLSGLILVSIGLGRQF